VTNNTPNSPFEMTVCSSSSRSSLPMPSLLTCVWQSLFIYAAHWWKCWCQWRAGNWNARKFLA